MNRYDWNAGEYAKHSKAQHIWARELIDRLHLQGRQSVLDIGCGDGKVTAEIAQAIPNGSVLGIDNSRSMIELAGWIRTTWLPYTQRIPELQQEIFIKELVDHYVKAHPPDKNGNIHVQMIRLEVEAAKTK